MICDENLFMNKNYLVINFASLSDKCQKTPKP